MYLFKNNGDKKLTNAFPEKDRKLRTLNYFLKKLCESGSTGRKPGSGSQQTIIDDVIDEWRARLRECVRARGGHLMFCSCLFVFFSFWCFICM